MPPPAVVARDLDHAEAHRLLGYVAHDGGWATPFAVAKLKDGDVLHPTFGWVEKDWVPHLDRGELPAPHVAGKPTKWLPRADADALRREFARGWQIRTEHFAILTNVPLAEAIDFGRHLEALDELFTSIMADVIGPADLPLARLARDAKLSPASLPPKRQHRVDYFAEKQEYVDHLAPTQGAESANTLGIFLPATERRQREGLSFFYRDPGGQLAETETLFHEVSHQLLFETAPGKYDGNRENFWVYEGLGTYFETVRPEPDGSLRVGGLVGKRISVARNRIIVRGEFIPIARMATYNKFLFNAGNGGDIYLNYAEAMALAVFFMDAHDARYREDFLDYARDVYKGRLRPGSGKPLEVRIGLDDRALGRDFLAFLKPCAEAQTSRTAAVKRVACSRLRAHVRRLGDMATRLPTSRAISKASGLFADVRHQRHEPGALDRVAGGPLEGGAVAAPLPREHLALIGAELLQQPHVLVVDVGRTGAALGRAEAAAILAVAAETFPRHDDGVPWAVSSIRPDGRRALLRKARPASGKRLTYRRRGRRVSWAAGPHRTDIAPAARAGFRRPR